MIKYYKNMKALRFEYCFLYFAKNAYYHRKCLCIGIIAPRFMYTETDTNRCQLLI